MVLSGTTLKQTKRYYVIRLTVSPVAIHKDCHSLTNRQQQRNPRFHDISMQIISALIRGSPKWLIVLTKFQNEDTENENVTSTAKISYKNKSLYKCNKWTFRLGRRGRRKLNVIWFPQSLALTFLHLIQYTKKLIQHTTENERKLKKN